jgi:hypothetical protein
MKKLKINLINIGNYNNRNIYKFKIKYIKNCEWIKFN